MIGFHAAGANVQGRTAKGLDSQGFESDCRADDVDDGVNCAYFVEVDLVDGNLVDICFGVAQASEYRRGTVGNAGRQIRDIDDPKDFG